MWNGSSAEHQVPLPAIRIQQAKYAKDRPWGERQRWAQVTRGTCRPGWQRAGLPNPLQSLIKWTSTKDELRPVDETTDVAQHWANTLNRLNWKMLAGTMPSCFQRLILHKTCLLLLDVFLRHNAPLRTKYNCTTHTRTPRGIKLAQKYHPAGRVPLGTRAGDPVRRSGNLDAISVALIQSGGGPAHGWRQHFTEFVHTYASAKNG
jgi:hypothetical protein